MPGHHWQRLQRQNTSDDGSAETRLNKAVLFGVLLITALHAFDELVLVIALPAIAAELGADQWYGLIIAGYVLASIIGMAWAGQRIDATSPRRVLQCGAAFFVAGLLLAMSSQQTAVFLFARILQGIGGGIGWTLAFGLISLLCESAEKPRAVAAMDVAWIIPSLLAPLIGGILIDYLNWRWIFALQLLPVFIALALIAPRITQLDKPHATQTLQQHLAPIIDACRIAVGTGALLYALAQPVGPAWLLLPLAFVIVRNPLQRCMPADWLRLRDPLGASLFTAMMAFLVFYGLEAWQPLYLTELKGFSTLTAGLALTCASLSWMLSSQLTAHNRLPSLLDSHSARLVCGMLILLTSFLLFGLLLGGVMPAIASYAVLGLAGFGMGLCFNTARSTALQHTPAGKEGFVAGAISLSVSLGLSLATGIGGALRNHATSSGGTLQDAMELIWLFSVAMAVVTTLLLWLHHSRLHRIAHVTT